MLENLMGKTKSKLRASLNLNTPSTYPIVSGNPAMYFDYAGSDAPISIRNLYNHPQFTKDGQTPPSFLPGDNNDFLLTSKVSLTTQNQQQLFGNLANGAGAGSFWVTLNNTYIAESPISIDGFDTTGTIFRARFGSGKLTANVAHDIRIERKAGALTVTLDGVVMGSVSMPRGFAKSSPPYPMYLGSCADGAMQLTGTVYTFTFMVYN